MGAVSGAVGAYINSGGCTNAVIVGAIAGAVAGVGFPNPTAVSSIGTAAGGIGGSIGGQYVASALDVCSCDGFEWPENYDEWREAARNGDVDLGLAVASGIGAGVAGGVVRGVMGYDAGYSMGLTAGVESFGVGIIEGLSAGFSEAVYGMASAAYDAIVR